MKRGHAFWIGIALFSGLVYIFMFVPAAVVIVLAFNSSEIAGFPITSFTLDWFARLAHDPLFLAALKTSFVLGLTVSAISTIVGTMAAYALARAKTAGANATQMFLTLPILVPHIILGVGLLLSFRLLGLQKGFPLLVAGHVAVTLPFVVLTTRHRFAAIPFDLEEAARTLGANGFHVFREVTLPLSLPAIVAGALFAFMMSFDEVTATLFWLPPNMQTVPTIVFGMLSDSVTPEVNALATVLIAISILFPGLSLFLARRVAARASSRPRIQNNQNAFPAAAAADAGEFR